jgi:hypothetical protein
MITRRGVLKSGLQLTLAGTLVATAGATLAADKCADGKMDPGLAGSLHYTDNSPDPGKRCAGCGLFTPGEGGCGGCSIFNSGVNANGHCDSWSPKG